MTTEERIATALARFISNTHGSRGIARHRIAELEKSGIDFEHPLMRAAIGRWAARLELEPPADKIAFRAYWAELLRYPLAHPAEDALDITPITEEESKQI